VSGEPEGEADGCGGGGEQGVWRTGRHREAVGDPCLANQGQQNQQALKEEEKWLCNNSLADFLSWKFYLLEEEINCLVSYS
jgi:hypothetical protein